LDTDDAEFFYQWAAAAAGDNPKLGEIWRWRRFERPGSTGCAPWSTGMPPLSETLPAADATVTLGLNKEPTDVSRVDRPASYAGPPHYRQQADRLRRLAATAPDSGICERLSRLARGFDNIAHDLEGGAVEVRHPERMPQ
jgi:hypothetical protein